MKSAPYNVKDVIMHPKKLEFEPKVFHRRISVRERLGKDEIEYLYWGDMSFEIVYKWEWYFKYRAALLQVKYPKYRVELDRYSTVAEGRSLARINYDKAKKRLTTAKRMVTKCANAISKYRKEQEKTLIPNYKNEKYLRTLRKREEYFKELNRLNSELSELQKALS